MKKLKSKLEVPIFRKSIKIGTSTLDFNFFPIFGRFCGLDIEKIHKISGKVKIRYRVQEIFEFSWIFTDFCES